MPVVLTISSVICEVLLLVSPVLEQALAVTHVAERDALRGGTADAAKEQGATRPLSRGELVAIHFVVPVATQHASAKLVAIRSEPVATHVVEQRVLQARAVFLVLPCAPRGAGQVGILNGSPGLHEIRFSNQTRFEEALPIAIRTSVVP